MEDSVKYQKVPEPHQTLLFKLVEVHRKHAESNSGVIPFYEQRKGREGLVLYPSGYLQQTIESYTFVNLRFLEKVGYLSCEEPDRPEHWIVLLPEAFDYYDYMHSPARRRWISDVWDKTERYWFALLFGLLGGLLSGVLGSWLTWLTNWLWQKLQ
jgi:hypothetical protein